MKEISSDKQNQTSKINNTEENNPTFMKPIVMCPDNLIQEVIKRQSCSMCVLGS